MPVGIFLEILLAQLDLLVEASGFTSVNAL